LCEEDIRLERWYFKGGMVAAFFPEKRWQEPPTLDMLERQ
jgi:hypothetical protein